MLETHPARFKVAAESDELGVEIREMILGKRRSAYRVHFMIFGREVVILRVRRSTQDELPVESLRALGSAWTFAGSKAASDLDRDE